MFQLVNRKLFNLLLKGTDVAWNRIPTSTITSPNHLCVRLDNVKNYGLAPIAPPRTHTNHGDHSERTPDNLDNTVDRDYLLEKCSDALNEIKNLNPAARSKAMDKLKNEPSWRAVFLELPNNRKKDWVLTL